MRIAECGLRIAGTAYTTRSAALRVALSTVEWATEDTGDGGIAKCGMRIVECSPAFAEASAGKLQSEDKALTTEHTEDGEIEECRVQNAEQGGQDAEDRTQGAE